DDVDLAVLGGLDGRPVVDGPAQRVDHAAQQALAHGHFEQAAGALDQVAFLHFQVVAVDDGADGVHLQVHHLAHDGPAAGLELEQLAGHGVGQAVDTGDAVADLDHAADLGDLELVAVLLELGTDDAGDLVGSDLHGGLSLYKGVVA